MSPLLVLDDVLSELDPNRCAALLDGLPAGQVVLTTASELPVSARPDSIITIASGTTAVDGSTITGGEASDTEPA